MKDLEEQLKKIFTETSRSEWQTVTFGDIAREVKETCLDPESEGIDKVVGLEHLTPLDIHIRDWKTTADSTTFTRVFRRGQVLFGRRRAYQKKAALAEFDGLCSGDIIVMEAIENKLDPDLLPFLVHSDKFYECAVSTSAGSLSPRTKFKHLAELKLQIPTIPIQKKVASLLLSIDNLKEKNFNLLENQQQLLNVWFSKKIEELSTGSKTLGSFLVEKPKYGASVSAVEYQEGEPRYIRITDIDSTGYLRVSGKVGIGTDDYEKYLLEEGDVLIARTADPGKCLIYEEKYGPCVYAGYLIKFKIDNSQLLPKFFHLFSQSATYKKYINTTSRTGTVSNINSEEFQSMTVPVIDIQTQKSLIEQSSMFSDLIEKQEKKLDTLSSLVLEITNSVI